MFFILVYYPEKNKLLINHEFIFFDLTSRKHKHIQKERETQLFIYSLIIYLNKIPKILIQESLSEEKAFD